MRTLNLGILAHVDAGKTSLTERLLFEAGATAELGSVNAGTTRTDSMDIERAARHYRAHQRGVVRRRRLQVNLTHAGSLPIPPRPAPAPPP